MAEKAKHSAPVMPTRQQLIDVIDFDHYDTAEEVADAILALLQDLPDAEGIRNRALEEAAERAALSERHFSSLANDPSLSAIARGSFEHCRVVARDIEDAIRSLTTTAEKKP